MASSAIVLSRFPSQVRQQLYQESMDQYQAAKEQEQARNQKFNLDI
jgi:hypothetical protein